MSWWDSIWSDAGDLASGAWDFAKANPELTGAVVGGLAGGGKGAVVGAGVGYGLSNFAPDSFGGGAYSLPRISEWGASGTPTSYSQVGSSGIPVTPGLTVTSGTGSFSGKNATQLMSDWTGGGGMSTGNTGVTGDFGSYGAKIEGGLNSMANWGKQNPRLASALVQGAGTLAAYSGQRKANQLLERQVGLQQAQFDKQNAQADYWNTQAQQSANEARSLYNPQEQAIRGMSQQVAATGRRESEARAAALARGMTPDEAAAEARRVRLAGSTNATTGYMAGLDLGRTAQQGALTSAKGLSAGYGAAPDYSTTAGAYRSSAAGTAAGLQSLLERYLNNPTAAIDEAKRRSMQEGSVA